MNKNVNTKEFFGSLGKKFKMKSRATLIITLAIITVIVTFLAMYFGLMPINFMSGGFRFYLVFLALLWSVPLIVNTARAKKIKAVKTGTGEKVEAVMKSNETFSRPKLMSGWGVPLFIGILLVATYLILSFFTAPLFLADNYRNLISVKENASFVESVENYDTMQIPVVDRSLASKLGDKKLGEDNFGSQFAIEERDYTMIAYAGQLYWVAPIEYQGFFQWTSKPRTPGYVMINATNQADVKIVREELEYVESAYFGDDLQRKIYFNNMFSVREGDPHLELDDSGRPMFVEAVYTKRFAFSGGLDVTGAIIADAKTGECNYFDIADVPSWVDKVQSEEVVVGQLNDWGAYVHGFFNSLFSKKEVTQLSTGLNYVYSNGKMYMQTGMTSIGSDESIVGVTMVDMVTKATSLNKVTGATEFAASQSAIGSEQAQRFASSDPIMINFNGVPTYFMMLKDDEGLVKRYSYVNVEDYRIVATRETQKEALTAYEALITPTKAQSNVSLDINEIRPVMINGNTVYLIKFKRNAQTAIELPENFETLIFKAPITVNLELAYLADGDSVKVDFLIGSNENIVSKIVKA